MAKVCDVDNGREDVREVCICDVFTGSPDALDSVSFAGFDACKSCRTAIAEGGLPELMQRYGTAHRLLKRERKPKQ